MISSIVFNIVCYIDVHNGFLTGVIFRKALHRNIIIEEPTVIDLDYKYDSKVKSPQ